MTRLIRTMTPEPDRCEEMTAAIEYDDGEPATIVPAPSKMAATGAGHRSGSCGGDDRVERSCLAALPRDAVIDYDDGDPATTLV